MLKRKLKTPIEHVVQSKKKAVETRLDGVFIGIRKPQNVEETLSYVRELVEWKKFGGKHLIVNKILKIHIATCLTTVFQVQMMMMMTIYKCTSVP